MTYQQVCSKVTRRVPLLEQELLTLIEHPSSPSVFSWVRVNRSLVFCVVFCRSLFCLFVLFLLAIVLSVLLRFMTYDPFSIFKFFLQQLLIDNNLLGAFIDDQMKS